MWSDCLLDLGTDFLVGNMVIATNEEASLPVLKERRTRNAQQIQHSKIYRENCAQTVCKQFAERMVRGFAPSQDTASGQAPSPGQPAGFSFLASTCRFGDDVVLVLPVGAATSIVLRGYKEVYLPVTLKCA